VRLFIRAVLCAAVVAGCTVPSAPVSRTETLRIPLPAQGQPDLQRLGERAGAILARHEARAFLRSATIDGGELILTFEGEVSPQVMQEIGSGIGGEPVSTAAPLPRASTMPIPAFPSAAPTATPRPIDLARAEAAARHVMSSVVLLSGSAQGTGFVVSADGYILTNAHVARSLSSGPPPTAQLHDGRKLPVRVIGYVESLVPDIGVVKIEATGLPVVELRDAASLQPNDPLVAVGHPGGYGYWLVTGGRVFSAMRIREQASNGPLVEYLDLHTEVPSSEGSSGSPFVDMDGKVVGILAGPIPTEIVEPVPARLKVLWTWKEFLALRRQGSKGIGTEDAMRYMREIVAKGGNLP
jgi:S1-C subfamily serine protease